MFNQLIESNSATGRDGIRKSYFILVTAAFYGLVVCMGGVVGVLAFDAHVENQNLELTALIAPVMQVAEEQQHQPRRNSSAASNASETVRVNPIDRIDRPTQIPPTVSTQASTGVEIPDTGSFKQGPENSDAGLAPTGSRGNGTGGDGTRNLVPDDDPPPVVNRVEQRPSAPKSIGVINSKAISLPKPPYPRMAQIAHIGGQVQVQVTIDETGRVISSHAVSGHPLLIAECVRAAAQARFSITYLSNVPVRATGIIIYNFTE